ncbi:hypothetical protein NECID01_0412 [Nematocida sp. AWRm77]|nr:hypothetical protein NECID01_0412 [Nematocida sp. AWRm77]
MKSFRPIFRIESESLNSGPINIYEEVNDNNSTEHTENDSKDLEDIDSSSCFLQKSKKEEDTRNIVEYQEPFKNGYVSMEARSETYAKPYGRFFYKQLDVSSEVQPYANVQEENKFSTFKKYPYRERNMQQRKAEAEEPKRIPIIVYDVHPRTTTNVMMIDDDEKDIYYKYRHSYCLSCSFVKSYIVDLYFKLARICIILPLFIGQFLALALMIYFYYSQPTSIVQLFYITFISVTGIMVGCETARCAHSILKDLMRYQEISGTERQKKLKRRISYPFMVGVLTTEMVLGGILLAINTVYLLYRLITPTVSIDPKHYFNKDWNSSNLEAPHKITVGKQVFHYCVVITVAMGYIGMVLGYWHYLIFEKHGDRSKRFRFVYIVPLILSFVGFIAGFIVGAWEIVDYCKNYSTYTSSISDMVYVKNNLPYLWEHMSSLGFCLLNIACFLVFYGLFRINPNKDSHKTRYRRKAVISYILLSITVGSLVYLMSTSLMMHFSFRYQMMGKEAYVSFFDNWLKTRIIDKVLNVFNLNLLDNANFATSPTTSMINVTVPFLNATTDAVSAA